MVNNTTPGLKRWFNGLTLLGAVLTIASAVFLFAIVPNYIGQPPFLENPLMAPSWLPTLAGWGILILSIGLVIQGLVAPPTGQTQPLVEKGVPFYRWLLFLVVIGIYLTLFDYLGAIAAGILCTALLFIAAGVRRWQTYLLAIVFPVLVSLLFVHLLNVPLPSGEVWQ